jgi:hypothetical protein
LSAGLTALEGAPEALDAEQAQPTPSVIATDRIATTIRFVMLLLVKKFICYLFMPEHAVLASRI